MTLRSQSDSHGLGMQVLGGHVLGIDVGGTAIKLGRFNPQGECLAQVSVPTPQPPLPPAVVAQIVAAIPRVDPDKMAIALGVGTPGPSDAQGRIARIAFNLEGWVDVPLADMLEAQTGLPTIVANDGNCAGVGEAWLGAGQTYQNFILLTLGTGVGGAIILKGELFLGPQGTAGELGLVTLNPDGPPCNSGNRGSLEQYASATAIQRQAGKSPEELAIAADRGEPEAIAFWQAYGRTLGAGLAGLTYILAPEAILLGGGVAASFEHFYPSLEAELFERVLPCSRSGLVIRPATLGNQAGMIGAAKLALEKSQSFA